MSTESNGDLSVRDRKKKLLSKLDFFFDYLFLNKSICDERNEYFDLDNSIIFFLDEEYIIGFTEEHYAVENDVPISELAEQDDEIIEFARKLALRNHRFVMELL